MMSQMSLILLALLCAVRFNTITCCHERDRRSLLSFKQGVVDPSNRLSSWSTLPDCCQWDGVHCDHNNRVVYLYLPNDYYFDPISNNHSELLRGEIPEQIGEMKDLESLDLSHNNLHGNIPQGMSGLSFLDVLNLSYNHFSGQIPLGTQLQSFDAWSYAGNPDLCGPPLQKNCTIPDNTEKVEENEDDGFLKSLYLGMGVGFAVGFWVVCGSLVLNRAWRHSYFRFFNGVVDRIYVIVAIKLQKFR
ncbi:receptor-like protein EIX2 [Neltuma alba]|uniref:receptor-like protein EIX2 n=1 Tax=Neltuma alba TaxID=207710 RepID=UPI0010A4CF51|nr:receptor-like protein EIX2 [Prosopis alba]